LVYISYYTKGLRILDATNVNQIIEVGYYDTPAESESNNNSTIGKGSWGIYPNLPSGNILLSDKDGLRVFNGPPSTPTGLTLSGSVGQNPILNWNSNPETDINAYKIYRKRVGTDNDYILIATVNAPGTSYTDNTITIGTGRFANYVYYKIKAEDVIDQLSEFSNNVRTKHNVQIGQKMMSDIQIPSVYALHTAYPNPFNPITRINYQLPEESIVVLKIYDLMGREIKSIMDGTEYAGFKNIMWDSKDNNRRPVPSGMYFYKLDALSKESDKEFHETKKMVLLK
jgi:hypothetical protein